MAKDNDTQHVEGAAVAGTPASQRADFWSFGPHAKGKGPKPMPRRSAASAERSHTTAAKAADKPAAPPETDPGDDDLGLTADEFQAAAQTSAVEAQEHGYTAPGRPTMTTCPIRPTPRRPSGG